MTGRNKPLDDLSNLMTNAVGAIKGVGDEVKAMGRSQAEKFIQDMDLVSREEFDVLKARLDVSKRALSTSNSSRLTRSISCLLYTSPSPRDS